ncbi:MAG: PilN domain-containing protein [Nitrospirota bacterium]|nr:MAG: PilN domain-containing protein [Nitrospirota bacterium]
MIRVNLLQIKRKKKAKPLPAFVVLGVLLTVIICLVAGLIYVNQTRKIKSLEATKRQNATRLQQLRAKVKEVEDFEAKIKQFEQQKQVITGLRAKQSEPVKIMNEMSRVLTDGVWLTKMNVSKNNIIISGNAFSNSNVVEFVNSLKDSGMFSNVYLVESKSKKVQEVSLFAFQIRFSIKAQGNQSGKKA